jgi:hypothetical protein
MTSVVVVVDIDTDSLLSLFTTRVNINCQNAVATAPRFLLEQLKIVQPTFNGNQEG